ncbi:MAG TPA: YbhB/YbcL family Raf kinase inhibitor-like protein [Micropepsaceae bacterium]|jgi:Raf kinase inhibitor-like YbhB/YbcL family protein
MKTVIIQTATALVLTTFFAVSADAQNQGSAGPPVLASKLAPARSGSTQLLVTSSAFGSGSELDDKFTQNGDNMSPPLAWTKGPPGTQYYAVLAEDAGVDRAEPIVHWVIYNIPSSMRGLPQNVPTDATLENGAVQGKNVRGAAGFIGPKPPKGQTHPYHFEVFALNAKLNLPANADRNAVVGAMRNHVLAQGDLMAMYTGK